MPVEIKIVHFIETANTKWLERYLHIAFDHRSARGEWFRLTAEEIAIFKAMKKVDDVVDLTPVVSELHNQNLVTGNCKRPGSGRPRLLSPDSRTQAYRATDAEHAYTMRFLGKLRGLRAARKESEKQAILRAIASATL